MNKTAKLYFIIAIAINGFAAYVNYELTYIYDRLVANCLCDIAMTAFYSYGIRWWPYAMCSLSIIGFVHCFQVSKENSRLMHAAFVIFIASFVMFMYSAHWISRATIQSLKEQNINLQRTDAAFAASRR
jgi:hypothetical protein